MKTFVCRQCQGIAVVGHPVGLFRRRARSMAREAYTLAERLLRGRSLRRKIVRALEQRFYQDPRHQRRLPPACPACGFRGGDGAPWWEPGVDLASTQRSSIS